jgi:multidrug efflux pump subunit AcrB
MPVDIFPYIDIPIVSVLWYYPGLGPEEMEKRVSTNFERQLTSNVNDIEHIESQSYSGYSVERIFFHPNVKIDMAVAQVTATMETSASQYAPGMFPANVLKYRRRQRAHPAARAIEQDSARAGNLRHRQ